MGAYLALESSDTPNSYKQRIRIGGTQCNKRKYLLQKLQDGHLESLEFEKVGDDCGRFHSVLEQLDVSVRFGAHGLAEHVNEGLVLSMSTIGGTELPPVSLNGLARIPPDKTRTLSTNAENAGINTTYSLRLARLISRNCFT